MGSRRELSALYVLSDDEEKADGIVWFIWMPMQRPAVMGLAS